MCHRCFIGSPWRIAWEQNRCRERDDIQHEFRAVVLYGGRSWLPGNIWEYGINFGCLNWGWWWGAIGIQWVETWDAAKILQHTGQPPTTKNCLASKVNKAEVEKLWFKQGDKQGFAMQTQGEKDISGK